MWILFLSICLGLSGCASVVEKNTHFAEERGLLRSVLPGDGFDHVVYFNQAALISTDTWHIYIEGDGRPWIDHQYIAVEPTAPSPLMLRIMSQDTRPAVYIARPCYEGLAGSAECEPWHWSGGRYSWAVVDSMAAVLNKLIEEYQVSSVTLLGHSGGGTLAMLIAPSVAELNTLVTISGNLDTDAWASKHGYTQLSGSLNPANQQPLPKHIVQYHYLGRKDRNIPLPAVMRFLESREAMNFHIVDHCGHTDCWEKFCQNGCVGGEFNREIKDY